MKIPLALLPFHASLVPSSHLGVHSAQEVVKLLDRGLPIVALAVGSDPGQRLRGPTPSAASTRAASIPRRRRRGAITTVVAGRVVVRVVEVQAVREQLPPGGARREAPGGDAGVRHGGAGKRRRTKRRILLFSKVSVCGGGRRATEKKKKKNQPPLSLSSTTFSLSRRKRERERDSARPIAQSPALFSEALIPLCGKEEEAKEKRRKEKERRRGAHILLAFSPFDLFSFSFLGNLSPGVTRAITKTNSPARALLCLCPRPLLQLMESGKEQERRGKTKRVFGFRLRLTTFSLSVLALSLHLIHPLSSFLTFFQGRQLRHRLPSLATKRWEERKENRKERSPSLSFLRKKAREALAQKSFSVRPLAGFFLLLRLLALTIQERAENRAPLSQSLCCCSTL